jgi:hypothetical protein
MAETYGRGSTLSMDGTPVAQIVSFQPPQVTVVGQDTTVTDSASVQETATMADFGSAKVTVKYDSTMHNTLLQAAAACLPHDWLAEYSELDDGVGSEATFTFTGPIKGFAASQTDAKGIMTADIEIRCNDFSEAEA